MDCRPMEIEKAFRKNTNGNDAADKDRPHEHAALLNVIDH
jgi:hypothetical protein